MRCCDLRYSGHTGRNSGGHEINRGREYSAGTHRKTPASKKHSDKIWGKIAQRIAEAKVNKHPDPHTASELAVRKPTIPSVGSPNQTALLEVNQSSHG
jgi:hypothetical protein